MASQDILVVDDEIGIRELLSEILQDEGYSVALAENAEQARRYRNQAVPKMVLLDIWMPDTDGITLLKEWSRNGQLTMPVIMMSGHATIDTAVEATRIGALDFLEKPIGLQKLLAVVKRAMSQPVSAPVRQHGLQQLGSSAIIQQLQETLDSVGKQRQPILLSGEPGAGFELCARYLTQGNAPFVAPSANDELALAPQELLQRASGGTLFLRDIAWLDRKAQQGLLSVLPRLEKLNVRLVSASSRHLDQLSGQLDHELLRQLSQVIVTLPALREHPEDIPQLAAQMLQQLSPQTGERHFSRAALQLLAQQSWPGNLDQLSNVVKSLALTCRTPEIDVLPASRLLSQLAPQNGISAAGPQPGNLALPQLDLDLPLRDARDQFEKFYLERQIELARGNMSRVAEKIGLERTHLYRKLKQLGIQMQKKSKAVEEEH